MLLKLLIILLCVITLIVQIYVIIIDEKKHHKNKKRWIIASTALTAMIAILMFLYSDRPKPEPYNVLDKQIDKGEPKKVIEKGQKQEKDVRDQLLSLQLIIIRAYFDYYIHQPSDNRCFELLSKYTNEIQQEVEYFRELGIEFLEVADSLRSHGHGYLLEKHGDRDNIFILNDAKLAAIKKLKIYDAQDIMRLTKIAQNFDKNDYVSALKEIEDWQANLQSRYEDIVQARLEAVHIPYFNQKLKRLRWINYKLDKNANQLSPLENLVRADFKLLVASGFRGLIIEFSAERDQIDITKIAQETGIEGIIWEVGNPFENKNLDRAYHVRRYVDAYYLNDTPKMQSSYDIIKFLRQKTLKPISISKDYWEYFVKEEGKISAGIIDIFNQVLINQIDFIMVDIQDPQMNVEELVLKDNRFKGFPLKIKRISFYHQIPIPSRGHGLNEDTQKKIYRELIEKTDISFAFYQAFDRASIGIDSCCGLFTVDRRPKLVVEYLLSPKLMITHKNEYGDLHSIKGKVINTDEPEKYKIITFINVDASWWIKPYSEFPEIYIENDATWQVPVITGGIDTQFGAAKLFLVKKEYTEIDKLSYCLYDYSIENLNIIDSVSFVRNRNR